MRYSRMLAIGVTVLTLGTAAAIAGAAIPAEAASTVRFVALGDSYSSGVGAGSTSGSWPEPECLSQAVGDRQLRRVLHVRRLFRRQDKRRHSQSAVLAQHGDHPGQHYHRR